MIALALAGALSVQPPPGRFDFPALHIEVVERPADEVDALCRALSGYRGTRVILACALPRKARCVVLFPAGVSRTSVLFRHEQAHCNGWPGTHPV